VFCAAALAMSILSKHGMVKLNKEYGQRVIFDDDFHNLGYVVICWIGGKANILLYVPLALCAYLHLSEHFNKVLAQKPNAPIISIPFLKEKITTGVNRKASFLELKSDLEVYIGIYLIAVWFIGWSNLIIILVHWQLMRVKYVINYTTQLSFRKVDGQITAKMPAVLLPLYLKLKTFMSYMASMDQPQPGAQQQQSRCNIF
jgi:hypothetical protein